MVERCVRDAEAASSNLVASIKEGMPKGILFYEKTIVDIDRDAGQNRPVDGFEPRIAALGAAAAGPAQVQILSPR